MQKLAFEIFGKVQAVSFRKYTASKAQELGLVGWVMNTKNETVIGEAVGSKDKIETLQHWLRHVGSPKSEIRDAKFTLTDADGHGYTAFQVRK